MQLYHVSNPDGDDFVGSLSAAKNIVKDSVPIFRADITVKLINVPTDKDNMLLLANGGDWRSTTLKTWRGTERGGLKEVETP